MSRVRHHSRPTCRCWPHSGNGRVRAAHDGAVFSAQTNASRSLVTSAAVVPSEVVMIANCGTGCTSQTSPASGAQTNPLRAQRVAPGARCTT